MGKNPEPIAQRFRAKPFSMFSMKITISHAKLSFFYHDFSQNLHIQTSILNILLAKRVKGNNVFGKMCHPLSQSANFCEDISESSQ